MEQTLFKISEAAKLLRVSKAFLYATVKANLVPSVWMGRHRFLHKDTVARLAKEGLPSQFKRRDSKIF